MDTQKTQIIDRLGQATNILVTVSVNPSVDQLAGAIGLTLLLNKLGKHATAVFSGQVPSTVEFLQPEKTLEKNTDSLRDFIIAMDKSKADKLRYKVEDQMVKIFITPYRTSISDKDLEFSQGDFNVEVVMALGVQEQQQLDEAIIAHGRILHDATVIGINNSDGPGLGSINWTQPAASSLCEMLLELGLDLKADVLDGQMATAFLTGIVAETNRFSNEKTSSVTMQMSAKLMAAGANQQLVASQLQPAEPEVVVHKDLPNEVDSESAVPDYESDPTDKATKTAKPADGSLQIEHNEETSEEEAKSATETPETGLSSEADDEFPDVDTSKDSDEKLHLEVDEPEPEQVHIDETDNLQPKNEVQDSEPETRDVELPKPPVPEQPAESSNGSRLVLNPPLLGGRLTANSVPEALDPSTDPLGADSFQAPLLTHDSFTNTHQTPLEASFTPDPALPALEDIVGSTSSADTPFPAPSGSSESDEGPDTLSDLEKVVDSPHLTQEEPIVDLPQPPSELPEPPVSTPEPPPDSSTPLVDVNAARDAVKQAMSGATNQVLEPVQALNAQPMDLNLGDMPAVNTSPESAFTDFNSTPLPASPNDNAVLPDSGLPPMPVFADPVVSTVQQVTSEPTFTPMPTFPDPTLPPAQPSVNPFLSPSDNAGTSLQDSTAPPPVPPPMMPPIMLPVVPPPDDSSASDTAL